MIVRTMYAIRTNVVFRKSINYRGLSSFLTQKSPKISNPQLYINNDAIAQCPRLLNVSRSVSSVSSITFPSWYVVLSNSTPVAYAQQFIVSFHEITGTPWWASIMLSAIALRLVVTLPLTAYQHYINSKLENLSVEFQPTVKEIQNEVVKAVKLQKWPEQKAQRVYNKAVKKYWNELIVKENCHPAKSTIVVWVQLPMWICMSIAIRNFTLMLPPSDNAVIRFNEFAEGGALWFPNLTATDPTMCLPLILCLTNLLIIEVQAHSRNKDLTRSQKIVTNIFRGFSVIMIPLSYYLPSGLSLYWTASSVYGLSQNLFLLSPRVRTFFGIPKTPYNHKHPYKYLIDKSKCKLSFS